MKRFSRAQAVCNVYHRNSGHRYLTDSRLMRNRGAGWRVSEDSDVIKESLTNPREVTVQRKSCSGHWE
jgi:hypothetical protein